MNEENRSRRIFNFTLALTIVLAFVFGFQTAGLMRLLTRQDRIPLWLSRAASGLSYDVHASPQGYSNGEMSILFEVLAHISTSYLYNDDIDTQEVIYGASEGAVSALGDRYSRFVPPPDQQVLTESIEGEYAGVGISIIDRPGVLPIRALECEIEAGADPENIHFISNTTGVTIVQVFEEGPAYEVGMEPDDVIVCVDGNLLRGASTEEAANLIKGPEGTMVEIVVWRPGLQEEVTLEIPRERVQVPTIGASEMLTDNIGYIRLDSFNNFSPSDVVEKINELTSDGMEGLIFDLRNNTGGPMSAAVAISDLFISSGVLVYYENSAGERETFTSMDEGEKIGIPLIVLVNGSTASASEIVAGAVRDTHTGIIVGEDTFGKGVVQNVYTLHDGSGLILTTGRYLTPDGNAITQDGLEPDIRAELDPEALRAEDPQVDEFLNSLERLNDEYVELRQQMYDYLRDHDFQRNTAVDLMSEWLETGEEPEIEDDTSTDEQTQ